MDRPFQPSAGRRGEQSGRFERSTEMQRAVAREHSSATQRLYFAVVVVTVCAHIAYLIYLPSGGFLALRWPRTLVFHVPTVAWGIAVVGLHLPCPLTQLEKWARARANLDPLPQSGFVDRYLSGLLVPQGRTGGAQAIAFVAAAVSWAVLAARRAQ
jgi:uncharacterized protein DUF2784